MPDDPRTASLAGDLLSPRDLAHACVQGAFSLVFPDPQVRAALGLRGISRAGHADAAWYLWTVHHAGAFEIALIDGCDDAGRASLAIRYFPSPDEASFAGFAEVERRIRCSSAFDATGTPIFDAAADLDPSLFHVGTLVLEASSAGIDLTLLAQDRWVEDTTPAGDGHVRRDVPGLDLALAAADPLVCALACLAGGAPERIEARTARGVRWQVAANGEAVPTPDAARIDWQLRVAGLGLPGNTNPDTGRWSAPATEVVPPSLLRDLPVVRRWLDAARWHVSPVGSCCCHCERDDAMEEARSSP